MISMEYLKIQTNLQDKFPGLAAQIVRFYNVNVRRELQELEEYKSKVINDTQAKWEVDKLRDTHEFRAYRDFFWKLDIDPTKNRPAAEALIRRVLRGRPIPKINTWVDAYNLVSITSTIPIASFDLDLLEGELFMREAKTGEKFLGIGMKEPVTMNGGESVIEDGTRLVAIYPYRDADYSKVSLKTANVLVLMCGAPGITLEKLNDSALEAKRVLPRFCGGTVD
jgi:DNA/RNA-binding domain of Phe-tRNA-synthetase-like protein